MQLTHPKERLKRNLTCWSLEQHSCEVLQLTEPLKKLICTIACKMIVASGRVSGAFCDSQVEMESETTQIP